MSLSQGLRQFQAAQQLLEQTAFSTTHKAFFEFNALVEKARLYTPPTLRSNFNKFIAKARDVQRWYPMILLSGHLNCIVEETWRQIIRERLELSPTASEYQLAIENFNHGVAQTRQLLEDTIHRSSLCEEPPAFTRFKWSHTPEHQDEDAEVDVDATVDRRDEAASNAADLNQAGRPSTESACSQHTDSNLYPPSMICPITGEPFEDPVLAEDGHSYERRAILHWFCVGSSTSPKTGAVIGQHLISNHALRNSVEETSPIVERLLKH